jgi:hypothetical protein
MNLTCPFCHSKIGMDDVNVSTDIALCRTCGKTCSFSQLVQDSSSGGPELSAPPAGAWFEESSGGFRVGASTRFWMAIFLVPFTCVWAGISLSWIYGTQIRSGHVNPGSSLFGLPFLIGSIFLIGQCAMNTLGKIEITRNGDNLSVFMGVGLLGWSRNYLWSDFNTAREDSSRNGWNFNRQFGKVIALEGKRRVTFGSMWTDERRYFVLSALRRMLQGSGPNQFATLPPPLFRR